MPRVPQSALVILVTAVLSSMVAVNLISTYTECFPPGEEYTRKNARELRTASRRRLVWGHYSVLFSRQSLLRFLDSRSSVPRVYLPVRVSRERERPLQPKCERGKEKVGQIHVFLLRSTPRRLRVETAESCLRNRRRLSPQSSLFFFFLQEEEKRSRQNRRKQSSSERTTTTDKKNWLL